MVGTLGCYENLTAAKEIPLLDLALTLKEGRRCLFFNRSPVYRYLICLTAAICLPVLSTCRCMPLPVLNTCYCLPLPVLSTCCCLPLPVLQLFRCLPLPNLSTTVVCCYQFCLPAAVCAI